MSRRYLRFDEAWPALEARGAIETLRDGWYKTHCPAHDDRHPSLVFHLGSKDGVSFVPLCMAGCSVRNIVIAIHNLRGEVADPGARKMRELLGEQQEWKDEDLARLLKVTTRTLQRRLRSWKQDGLRWIRRPYSKIYDVSGWRGDTTSKAALACDTTQSKKGGIGGREEGSLVPPEVGGLVNEDSLAGGSSDDTTNPNLTGYSDARKNVVSLVGPIVDYDYFDPVTGALIAIKRRYVAAKEFRWFHRTRSGDWRPTLGYREVKDLPLYNAHKLAKCPPDRYVVLVEGEKAADALTREGALGVCFAGGAGATRFEEVVWQDLANHCVILWPDNDDPGRAFMRRVDELIRPSVLQLHTVEPPGLPEGGDAYDFFAAGGTVKDLLELVPYEDVDRWATHFYCPACYSDYYRHIGKLCPNPKCINNPNSNIRSPRWARQRTLPEEDDEELTLTVGSTAIWWEDLLHRVVRVLGCEDGCTHQEHQDDEVRMLIMLKALRAPKRLIHPQRPGFFGKE